MHNRILRTCWLMLAVALMLVSTAKAQTSCSVGYSVTATWSGGFNGGITIFNTGTTSVSSWTLGFAFANGQVVSSSWNSTYTQSGANVTLTNVSYDGSIAPGGVVTGVGFTASAGSTNAAPTAFTLNGVACSIASSTGSFTVSGPSSISVQQGGYAGGWFSLNAQNGFNGSATFSVSGLPSGVSAGYSANPASGGTWIQFYTSSGTPPGTYTVTVTATSAATSTNTVLTASTTFSLIVQGSAGFTLSGPSSVSVTQGSSSSGQISVVDQNGFNGSVTLSVSGLPASASAAIATNPTTTGSSIQFSTSTSTPQGTYPLTITGTSGSLTSSITVSLVVNSTGNFKLSASPSSLTVQPGGSCPVQINVGAQNGFNGNVTLSASGLPSGVTAAFGTNPTANSSTVSVGASSSVAPGNYSLAVNGVSGSLTASTTLGLTVSSSAITVTPDATTLPFAQHLTVNVAVTCGSGMPTGSVVLSGPGYTSASQTLSNGTATFYVLPGSLPVGTDTLTATFTPDSSSSSHYGTITGTASITVTAPGTTNVSVNINPLANRHLISPYIYGFNTTNTANISGMSPSLVRFGGNAASNYNWKLHTYNAGGDWFFESFGLWSPPGYMNDSVQLTSYTVGQGSHMLTTIPMLNWVAQQSGWSFSVKQYGPQCKTDPGNSDAGNGQKPDCSTPITTQASTNAYYPLVNTPQDCPSGTTDGTTCIDRQTWAQALATAFGSNICNVPYSAITSCHFYDLDNEPEIWDGSHKDVHPIQSGYTELANSFVNLGNALKSWDPSAVRFGPITCCWNFLWTAGPTGDNKAAHAGVDYVPWWLNHVYWQDQINGSRSLDAFDIHAYLGDNIDTTGFTTAQMRAEVGKYVREYWDPTYANASIDQDWITTTQPNRSIMFIIPRMKALINAIYPGTPLSFTEWESFWSEWEFPTALSDADAFGAMGREGLSFSTRWGGPDQTDTTTNLPHPNYTAFRLWTNYDGARHGFGTLSISDTSSANPDQFVSYAALNSTGNTMTIMVLNKDPNNKANVSFNLNNFTASTYTSYTVSSTNPGAIVSSTSQGWSSTQTFAPYSITLLVVNGTQSPAPATEWYMKADDLMIPAGGVGLLNPSNYSGSTNVNITSVVFDAFEGAPVCSGSFNVTNNTIYQYWPSYIYVTAPTTPGFCHYTVTGNDGTVTSTQGGWIVVGKPSGTLTITSGNGQSATHGTTLSVPLTVTLNAGASGLSNQNAEIFFSTSAGTLSNGTSSGSKVIAITNGSGVASVTLTLPATAGTVTVYAQSQFALGGTTVSFTETAQ